MFAEALEEAHSDLEVLDLGFNEINYDGGLTLIAAIQNKPKLRVLNLDGNCFGSEGTLKIKEEMSKCPNREALQSLDEVVSEEEEENDENQQSNDEDEDDTIEYAQEDEYGDDADEDGDYDPDDTTEEVDEADEEYGNENSAEETAYVTTNTFPNQVREPIKTFKLVQTSNYYFNNIFLFIYAAAFQQYRQLNNWK